MNEIVSFCFLSVRIEIAGALPSIVEAETMNSPLPLRSFAKPLFIGSLPIAASTLNLLSHTNLDRRERVL